MNSSKSLYERLGVSRDAELEEIHSAFRRLSKTFHPDTTTLPEAYAAQQFQLICNAYELLSDPSRRKLYDSTLPKSESSLSQSISSSPIYSTNTQISGVLRPLSGGEWFALMLLAITLLFSLLVGIGLAFLNGRQLQTLPSWLDVDQTMTIYHLRTFLNVDITFS